MFWGLFYKFFNICSRKNNKCLITTPKNILKPENSNNLNIVSYNINGLFLHYNHINYVNISKYIKYLFTQENIDIICLQEVWEKNIEQMIKKELQNLDLYYAKPPTNLKYCIGENSGLLTISRYPIVYNDFLKFPELHVSCKMTNKGLHYLCLKYNEEYLHLINTHLQSSFNRCNFQYQETCLKQLNLINEYIIQKGLKDCIIIGDLNLKEEYIENINENLKIPYNYKGLVTFPGQKELLDYFIINGDKWKNDKIEFKIYEDIYYSDHLPIFLSITKKKDKLRKKIIISVEDI